MTLEAAVTPSLRPSRDPREIAHRRLLHHHIVLLLKAPDQVVGYDLRHQIVPVAKSAAAIALECEAQGETKLIGIGGRQIGRVFGHGGRLDDRCEQSKNSQAPDASPERNIYRRGEQHGAVLARMADNSISAQTEEKCH